MVTDCICEPYYHGNYKVRVEKCKVLKKHSEKHFELLFNTLPIIEARCNPSISIFVKEVLARIFAVCHDSRVWDIYIEILPKKSAYCEWGRTICSE